MKKLLSFVAVLAMALVVAPCVAKAGTYYFDNTATGWDYVSVWSWLDDGTLDPLYEMSNELNAWPGVELSKDDATGYYVWNNNDPAAGTVRVMFNNGNADNAATEQTCDALAEAAADGKVCAPTVQNTADDEAADAKRKADQWYGEWKEVGAADAETPDAETPDAETPDAETPDAETPDAETPEVTPDAGKDEAPQTGDVAPIAAVAVLAVASMAVVVATRKKMA